MKSALLAAAALVTGNAAFAQSGVGNIQPPATPAWQTPAAEAAPPTMPTPAAEVVTTANPDNARPERDSRGIRVISHPADVPAGYNGTSAGMTGTGGPLVATPDAATTPDPAYPACSRTVTDNCVQAYQRGRRR